MSYKEKQKVAFVVSSMNTGGAQRMVSNIITHFPEEWEIDLILNSDENMVYPYKGNIISMGIKEPSDRGNIWYQGKVFLKRLCLLWKLKKKRQYVAVVSFLDSANIANILTGNRYCKTIVSVRTRLSGVTTKTYKIVVNNLVRLLYNRADKVVAISEGVREDLQKNFNIKQEKLCTIYNGYDTDFIKKQSKQKIEDKELLKKLEGNTVIANTGRMVPSKGQWHLIKAFSLLVEKYDNVRLLIIGNGLLENELKELCKKLNVEDKVIFTGFLKNPFSTLSRSSFFVFSSVWEGFGNALVEAMVCGLACIATDFKYGAREILAPSLNIMDYTDEILHESYGIITPNCELMEESLNCTITDNERKLAHAISEMLLNTELRIEYAKKASERGEYFHIDRIVGEWVALINE